ncbi:Ras GTPase-activating-like protein IQGAP2 [Varanus komodoensis]|nr:Ras GTPase-activating-like protein IQGAP2 [Varanus komodoensis]
MEGRWMEVCLAEELPPTTELEEGLRNGVYLAKLAKFFAPKLVSDKKIYDVEQTRYKRSGLHFRHTDNTVQWLRAMESIGLPKIFYPETTDVYDRKNIPRMIYCIHALSLYLFKLGIAPQIQDLLGKVDFTEEEISNMRKELEKYGIQMPSFSKIGGILASELSVDEAASHYLSQTSVQYSHCLTWSRCKREVELGIISILVTPQPKPPGDLFQRFHVDAKEHGGQNRALWNPMAKLPWRRALVPQHHLLESAGQDQWNPETLTSPHFQKYQNPSSELFPSWAKYTCNSISRKQKLKEMHAAVIAINEAIERGIADQTVKTLKNPNAVLVNVNDDLALGYQKELSEAKKRKEENARLKNGSILEEERDVYEELLTQAEIQGNINKVNIHLALVQLNEAIDMQDEVALMAGLNNPALSLLEVLPQNSSWYLAQLFDSKRQRMQIAGVPFLLDKSEIQNDVSVANEEAGSHKFKLTAVDNINAAIRSCDPNKTVAALMKPEAQLPDVYPSAASVYQTELFNLQQQNAVHYLAHDELSIAVEMLSAVVLLNQALENKNIAETKTHLSNPSIGFNNLENENLQRYADTLMSIKLEASSQGQEYLSWNDIQNCIDMVNTQIQEENDRIIAIGCINEAIDRGDPTKTVEALLLPTAKLHGVKEANAYHYQEVLKNAKTLKCQVKFYPLSFSCYAMLNVRFPEF